MDYSKDQTRLRIFTMNAFSIMARGDISACRNYHWNIPEKAMGNYRVVRKETYLKFKKKLGRDITRRELQYICAVEQRIKFLLGRMKFPNQEKVISSRTKQVKFNLVKANIRKRASLALNGKFVDLIKSTPSHIGSEVMKVKRNFPILKRKLRLRIEKNVGGRKLNYFEMALVRETFKELKNFIASQSEQKSPIREILSIKDKEERRRQIEELKWRILDEIQF